MTISNEELDSERNAKIKAMTDEIAEIKEEQKLSREEFQKKDNQYEIKVSVLIRERLKLINERRYGNEYRNEL